MSIFRRLQDEFKSFLRYKERQKHRENRKLSAVSLDTKEIDFFSQFLVRVQLTSQLNTKLYPSY